MNMVFSKRKMFGDDTCIINDTMYIGVTKNALILRCMDAEFENILLMKYVEPM